MVDFAAHRRTVTSMALGFGIGVVVLHHSHAVAAIASSQSSGSAVLYTKSQAKRGADLYVQACASCHLEDLSGQHTAPALADDTLIRRYEGRTLADMYERIKTTMPQGAAGSLSDQAYADILAYILQANQFRAGAVELAPDMNQLKQIAVSVPKQP